jgi:hypothetical protein
MVAAAWLGCESSSSNMTPADLAVSAEDLAGADLAGAVEDLSQSASSDLAGNGADLAGGGSLLRLYGGSRIERDGQIVIADGAYYIASMTSSNDGDLTGKKATLLNNDIWVMKLDAVGDIVWSKVYGGNGYDRPYEMIRAADGDLVILARTDSTNGDVTQAFGNEDIWLFKINPANGDLRWQVSFGGGGAEEPEVVTERVLPNNVGVEYTVLGVSKSNLTGNLVDSLNGIGDMLIGRYYVPGSNPSPTPTPNPYASNWGGNGVENGAGFLNENTIVAQSDSTTGGEVTGTTANGWQDVIVTGPDGTFRYGGDGHDFLIKLLPDGVFFGHTWSQNGAVNCNKYGAPGDFWWGRITTTTMPENHCFGGMGVDEGRDIVKLQDGRYVAIGLTASGTTGDITAPNATGALVMVLDASLQLQSHFFLGVVDAEVTRVALAPDGDVVFVGKTNYKQGAYAGNHGEDDLFVQKMTIP